ncbi:replication factor C subunit 3 [Pavlovales sp. CCMP2436]|nr:replication factor C subunit 3 [Pavlovales sp. CCMP2436]
MLWVDKYRPRSMDALDYHVELSQSLKAMVNRSDFPHILFYGPSGAGKKTRVLALLRDIYGPAVEKVKVDHKQFKVGSTTVEISILSSPHHIELNPGDAGSRDRDVVQEIIKEIAASAPLPTSSSGDPSDWKPFKVVVLNEVDNLSKEAQHALRRTMEKYITTCRIMMTCNNACRVIAPIRSRCLCVRIAAPSAEQIAMVLHQTARKEALTLPNELAERLALQAHGNLRKALLTLEAARVTMYPFDPKQEVKQADWEKYIDNIALEMLREQSPTKLGEIRNKLYDLLAHCIPPDMIMEQLTRALLGRLKHEKPGVQMEVLYNAALYEHRMISGSKAIFHLEAFVAKFMAVYKRAVHQAMGM